MESSRARQCGAACAEILKLVQRSTLKDLQLRLVPLQRGRSYLLGGLRTVFPGLCFAPNLPLNFRVSLGAFLQSVLPL